MPLLFYSLSASKNVMCTFRMYSISSLSRWDEFCLLICPIMIRKFYIQLHLGRVQIYVCIYPIPVITLYICSMGVLFITQRVSIIVANFSKHVKYVCLGRALKQCHSPLCQLVNDNDVPPDEVYYLARTTLRCLNNRSMLFLECHPLISKKIEITSYTFMFYLFNSLGLSHSIWCHKTCSTLLSILACCQTVRTNTWASI